MSYATLRYGTDSLALDNEMAPEFSHALAQEYYTRALDLPSLQVTERYYPSTELRWQTRNTRGFVNAGTGEGDRYTLWDWWDTTLARGTYPMTVWDHRRRFLFDVYWDQWKERWKVARGGVYDIPIDLHSPFPWTPPCFGLYTLVASTSPIPDHGLDTSSALTVFTGSLVDYAADHDILRRNGYALRISEMVGNNLVVGAHNGQLTWRVGKPDLCTTLFCQARVPNMSSGAGNNDGLSFIYLSDRDGAHPLGNCLRIFAERWDDTHVTLKFGWKAHGKAEEVITTDTMAVDTWYDLALSWDAVAGVFYGYFWPSATGTSWASTDDFLHGATATTEGYVSQDSPTNVPDTHTWRAFSLLRASPPGALFEVDSPMSHAFVQNAMAFNGYVSPLEFNFLRRLCHLWNTKTEQYPK